MASVGHSESRGERMRPVRTIVWARPGPHQPPKGSSAIGSELCWRSALSSYYPRARRRAVAPDVSARFRSSPTGHPANGPASTSVPPVTCRTKHGPRSPHTPAGCAEAIPNYSNSQAAFWGSLELAATHSAAVPPHRHRAQQGHITRSSRALPKKLSSATRSPRRREEPNRTRTAACSASAGPRSTGRSNARATARPPDPDSRLLVGRCHVP